MHILYNFADERRFICYQVFELFLFLGKECAEYNFSSEKVQTQIYSHNAETLLCEMQQ